jgi:hypothetical protein
LLLLLLMLLLLLDTGRQLLAIYMKSTPGADSTAWTKNLFLTALWRDSKELICTSILSA